MTITAGFKVRDGILLCADTEYSGGTKVHKEKIITHYFTGGALAFAIAGHETYAKMAIRDCCYELTLNGEPYSKKHVESVIRRGIKSVYDGYVTTAPSEEKDYAQFELIIAVCFEGQEPYLLASAGRGVDSVDDFRCHGTGWYLADYIIRQSYDPLTIALEQVAVIALQFLSAAKRHCEGVSGPSQFLTVVGDEISDVVSRDFGVAEDQIRKYEQAVGQLLLAVGNVGLPESGMTQQLERFVDRVSRIHGAWSADSAMYKAFLQRLSPQPNKPINSEGSPT